MGSNNRATETVPTNPFAVKYNDCPKDSYDDRVQKFLNNECGLNYFIKSLQMANDSVRDQLRLRLPELVDLLLVARKGYMATRILQYCTVNCYLGREVVVDNHYDKATIIYNDLLQDPAFHGDTVQIYFHHYENDERTRDYNEPLPIEGFVACLLKKGDRTTIGQIIDSGDIPIFIPNDKRLPRVRVQSVPKSWREKRFQHLFHFVQYEPHGPDEDIWLCDLRFTGRYLRSIPRNDFGRVELDEFMENLKIEKTHLRKKYKYEHGPTARYPPKNEEYRLTTEVLETDL